VNIFQHRGYQLPYIALCHAVADGDFSDRTAKYVPCEEYRLLFVGCLAHKPGQLIVGGQKVHLTDTAEYDVEQILVINHLVFEIPIEHIT